MCVVCLGWRWPLHLHACDLALLLHLCHASTVLQQVITPKTENFGSAAHPNLVWKLQDCVLVWMGRNWDFWKRWGGHPHWFHDWVLSVTVCPSSILPTHITRLFSRGTQTPSACMLRALTTNVSLFRKGVKMCICVCWFGGRTSHLYNLLRYLGRSRLKIDFVDKTQKHNKVRKKIFVSIYFWKIYLF